MEKATDRAEEKAMQKAREKGIPIENPPEAELEPFNQSKWSSYLLFSLQGEEEGS